MADSQSNARLRADAGAPTSGVIHVRARLTADFTVISNALAQRRGSAVTVGVATYISSLPTGTLVSITALCEHFAEGEILISRALRELEAAGYLERRRERTPAGKIRTRTYFYDIPGGDPALNPDPDGPPEPPRPRRPRKQPATAAVMPTPASASVAAEGAVEEAVAAPVQAEAEASIPLAATEADPRAIAVLAALRRVDPRLVVSVQEAARLAPAVTRWLTAGILPTQITDHLTTGLPDRLLVRPVGILGHRLKETPLPLPAPAGSAEPPVRQAVAAMRNCDGCERGFRSAEHSRCRDCRSADHLRAAG
ncbi:hypothetical protein [Streptomyces europaeiscabiei]|uniref:hypothetical protein n=1 Tax=Streptomyces europaeiscabiei TaxID=146819 RepID=UPI0029B843B4|nr:hypothetical protein [Streptomyces europaeiscabiei]MDX3670045.1 hypothetical protein [Streptomyces europaeiscabiei]